MNPKYKIKGLIFLIVFCCSFIFQTAYSLGFQEGETSFFDLINDTHITKKSQKEAIGDESYIEKEKESEKESDSEGESDLALFFELFNSPNICGSLNASLRFEYSAYQQWPTNPIFIAIHNLRI